MDNSGICARSEDGSIKCCVNHYLKEDSCQECPLGSFGWGCKTLCPAGSYGWLCSNQCNCPDDVCDHVKGCSTKKNRTASTFIPTTPLTIQTASRSDIQNTVDDSSIGMGLKSTMRPIFTSPILSTLNIIQSTSTTLISTVTKTTSIRSDKPAADFAIFLVPIGIIIVMLLVVIILLIAWKLKLVQRHNQVLTSEVVALKKIPATDEESANYQEINVVPDLGCDGIRVKESYRNFHSIPESDIYQLPHSKYEEIHVEEDSTIKEEAETNISAAYLLPTTSRSKHTYIDIIDSSPENSETLVRTSDDSETVSVTEKYDDTICSRYNECISSENMYLNPI